MDDNFEDGWNICMWLECISVVSGCCCKEDRYNIDIFIIIITFPYSIYISTFGNSIPTYLFIF